MKTNADILIDQYEDIATRETSTISEATQARITANILTKWRDCLIRVASEPYSPAANMAKDLLREAGYCDHARTIYKAQLSGRANAYTCPDCGKASPEFIRPYQ